jgi:hypothetical protein
MILKHSSLALEVSTMRVGIATMRLSESSGKLGASRLQFSTLRRPATGLGH